jgi:hypothetical protein
MSLNPPRWLRIAAVFALHLAALGLLYQTEYGLYGQTLFALTWVTLNCVFLVICRRPGISAALTLALFSLVVVLSKFKFDVTWMTLGFLDFMIIDADTFAFLLQIFPDLRTTIFLTAVIGIPGIILIWRFDPFRVSRVMAAILGIACFQLFVVMSLAVPEEPTEPFQGVNHVSNVARSGVLAAYELATTGWIETDKTADKLRIAANETCNPPVDSPAVKRPNIILILDEASFDITAVPGIKVPPGYGEHFKSIDGKARTFLVEGSGGPTWYTEYNVLTGLSARSYGRLKFYVTRIAADRVERGLPHALRRCGYKTTTLYPAYGAFLSARKFQETTGIGRFVDSNEMKAGDIEPDRFFYRQALKMIESEKGDQPLFIFVYTTFNHFPWWNRLRPELTPDWRDLGNEAEVDEYIRRQTLSARDYADFKKRLVHDHPKDAFLMLRFGDHQPGMARIIDPAATEEMITRSMMTYDPRYFTTYYALDAINFQPKDMSSALDRLEAPYLPLLVQEAAGLPLDPSFAEQKKILERCHGLFFQCAGGAEARRFNRLLIDAGLIKGMVSR